MEPIRGTHRVLLEIHQPRPPLSFGAELLTLFNGYSASHRVARFIPNGGVEVAIDLKDEPKYTYDERGQHRRQL